MMRSASLGQRCSFLPSGGIVSRAPCKTTLRATGDGCFPLKKKRKSAPLIFVVVAIHTKLMGTLFSEPAFRALTITLALLCVQ